MAYILPQMRTLPLIPSSSYDFGNVATGSSLMIPVIQEIPSFGHSKGMLQVAYNQASFGSASEKITLSLHPITTMRDGATPIGAAVATVDLDSTGDGILTAGPFDVPPKMALIINAEMGSSAQDCKATIKASLTLSE